MFKALLAIPLVFSALPTFAQEVEGAEAYRMICASCHGESAMGEGPLADLLRVLLKSKSEELGVAQKLIATASDLDEIAAGLRDNSALKGWRKEAFGDDALRLCDGKLGLRANGQSVEVFEI